jgi:hypothetical protein
MLNAEWRDAKVCAGNSHHFQVHSLVTFYLGVLYTYYVTLTIWIASHRRQATKAFDKGWHLKFKKWNAFLILPLKGRQHSHRTTINMYRRTPKTAATRFSRFSYSFVRNRP